MIDIRKPVFPKEHGLWAWVFLPLIVGAGCAKGDHAVMIPLLLSVFSGFMAYTPARIMFKAWRKGTAQDGNIVFWFIIYAAAALAFTLFTAAGNPSTLIFYAALALAFALALGAAAEGFGRSAAFEFGGLIFLSVVLSFLGAYAVSGAFDQAHIAPWALTLLFMLERSIAARRVVRLGGFIPALAQKSPKHALTLKTVFMQNLGLSFLSPFVALVIAQKLGAPLLPAAAFLPGFFTTLHFYLKPPAALRSLGFAELYLSLFFAAAFIFLCRL